MSLQKCALNISPSQKELHPHGTIEFPCAAYHDTYTDHISDIIPWHWHEELEVIYIREGTLVLMVPSEEYTLHTGDLAVLNGNLLHLAKAAPRCELQSLVFSHLLLTGSSRSVFFQDYMKPLMDCPDFTVIRCGEEEGKEAFRCAFHAMEKEPFGYEFTVREKLSGILLACFLQMGQRIYRPKKEVNQDVLRLEKMFQYIELHYGENISLEQIAGAADIGERECLRCFKRTIGDSPMQYLLKYRLMQSAALLLYRPSLPVSEVAAACGFDYSSYYSKQFRRFYQCTPREYRAAQRQVTAMPQVPEPRSESGGELT